jgi:hydroxymethylpyrimidine/phosphomethylpyrimidine kinase
MKTMAQAVTIAGSDSGGGAGIQADIKAMQANGVFATSVITSITAQNTKVVRASLDLPVEIVDAQLKAVFDDFDIAAAKTGMLSSPVIVHAVSQFLDREGPPQIVIDPVMMSKSGYSLLHEKAIESVKLELFPLGALVTPNLPEAEILAGIKINSIDDMKEAAERLAEYKCRAVLVKGGHAEFSPATDVLFDGTDFHILEGHFIDTENTHGTGCTYSAAITARLALGEPLLDAVRNAKHYITRAIENAPDIGKGHGPTHHFYFIDKSDALK